MMAIKRATPTNVDELRTALLHIGHIDESATLTLMHGGVSSVVVVVDQHEQHWVARVPLERLAVEDDWIVDQSRIANEAAILKFLEGRLGPVRIPRLKFFDPTWNILGEELILGEAPTYKEELLAGRTHPSVAASLGAAASQLHRLEAPDALSGDGPRHLFDALRLDPYYRVTAQRMPALRTNIEQLIEETVNASPRTLVHGDLTPKNVLVTSLDPVLLDWEVVSVGDPAFDLGTVTAHLMLKTLRDQPTGGVEPLLEAGRRFWDAYDGPADRYRGLQHTGAVMLARLHGKSPVEYLDDLPARMRVQLVGESALAGEFDGFDALAAKARATLEVSNQI